MRLQGSIFQPKCLHDKVNDFAMQAYKLAYMPILTQHLVVLQVFAGQAQQIAR